jgi:anti-anti-sigma regulatory factor
MEFTQNPTPDGIVISIHGNFTFKDHYGFRAVLDALAASSGTRKTLDLSKVEFLDSAALGMLMIAEEETARARHTDIAQPISSDHPTVRTVGDGYDI